jgi:hypothetical protein
VIAGTDDVCSFERPQVRDVGNDNNHGWVAPWVSAHGAWILSVDVAAHATHLDLVDRRLQSGREGRHQQLTLLDQVQRRASRGAWAEAWQTSEQLDQALDLRAGNRRGHLKRASVRAEVAAEGHQPSSAFSP